MLGAAWPVMHPEIGASFESAGLVSMIVSAGTILSSLFSGTIIERFGTGKVTLYSCCLTAGALAGFSIAPSLLWLMILAVPLGLGGGAVDAGLNHYVATHYKAHHMSWLHCFWGVGATMGPVIMSQYLVNSNSWREGYWLVAMIQLGLVLILFITLPLWKRVALLQPNAVMQEQVVTESIPNPETHEQRNAYKNPIHRQGVKATLVAFLFYSGVESTVGLWGASYLVGAREIPAQTAAAWVSMYYGGITIGRLITGFITLKVNNRVLILLGQLTALAGGLLLVLPLPSAFTFIGFILMGLGLAPIFPGLLHETPARFGKEHSSKLIGYQMAVAFTGTTLLPPVFGLIASHTTIALFPGAVLIFVLLMLYSSERVIRQLAQRKSIDAT